MVEQVSRYATYVTSFACAVAVVVQVQFATQIRPRPWILDPESNFHFPFQTALLPSWWLHSPQADEHEVHGDIVCQDQIFTAFNEAALF